MKSEINLSEIEFSKPVQSRKNKNIKYVYLSSKNEDNQKSSVSIESPKLTVTQHSILGNHSDKSVLQFDLSADSHNNSVQDLAKTLQLIYKNIASHFVRELHSGYEADLNSGVWKLKVLHTGDQPTLFFCESSKKELEDLELTQPPALSSSFVRMIAVLDGVKIDETSKSIRPVWSVDQLLLYSEGPVNPFGRKYSFIDDDDEYDSLDDE